MNYFRELYETTARLLMLQVQMRDHSYSTVVSRFIYKGALKYSDSSERAVESIAILLSLERNGEPMFADIVNKPERNIAKLDPENFPESVRGDTEADLRTAKNVIGWYRNTVGKLQ